MSSALRRSNIISDSLVSLQRTMRQTLAQQLREHFAAKHRPWLSQIDIEKMLTDARDDVTRVRRQLTWFSVLRKQTLPRTVSEAAQFQILEFPVWLSLRTLEEKYWRQRGWLK